MTALDWFGRRCLAWPAVIVGATFTVAGGWLLHFAAWLLEIETEAA